MNLKNDHLFLLNSQGIFYITSQTKHSMDIRAVWLYRPQKSLFFLLLVLPLYVCVWFCIVSLYSWNMNQYFCDTKTYRIKLYLCINENKTGFNISQKWKTWICWLKPPPETYFTSPSNDSMKMIFEEGFLVILCLNNCMHCCHVHMKGEVNLFFFTKCCITVWWTPLISRKFLLYENSAIQ
jgi:hypothetical protein